MFMGRKQKVTATREPGHPLFIGPRLPKLIRNRLKMRVHFEANIRVRATLQQSHPLFIGPRFPIAERIRLKSKQWREENPGRTRDANREYHKNNRDKLRDMNRLWREKNRVTLSIKKREAGRERRKDPLFRLVANLRCRVRNAIREQRSEKAAKTMQLVGCSVPALRAHLESQFLPGMTWDNNSTDGWHVDHIIPCRAFDLTDPDHQRMCFHYTNLRPIWALDNLSKGDRITPEALSLIVTSQETVETDVLPVYIERAG